MSRSTADAPQGPYRAGASISARKTALRRGEYPVAVYGLGKIGLPVAVAMAELTGRVTGVDTDPAVVDAVNRGATPFDHEPELPERLSSSVNAELLEATDDGHRAAGEATIHVVVVPVGLDTDGGADLSALEAVVGTIASGLSRGDVVIIESTVPPGTTADVVAPLLATESGLDAGAFGLAVAPERTASGRALHDIEGAYPRVVGGRDDASTDAAFAIYDELVDNRIIPVDAVTAELTKLFEGVYRDVNIALANELARAWDGKGVDVRAAIEAANTQPYCDIHEPGAGVGGHCIPWYPQFLMAGTERPMPLTRTARSVNERMPAFLARRTIECLEGEGLSPDDATVAVLGLAYRPEIPETAASPTYPLVERLEQAGVRAVVVDPVVADAALEMRSLEALPAIEPDAIVLVTAHEAFATIPEEVLEQAVIVDGRDEVETDATREYVVGRSS